MGHEATALMLGIQPDLELPLTTPSGQDAWDADGFKGAHPRWSTPGDAVGYVFVCNLGATVSLGQVGVRFSGEIREARRRWAALADWFRERGVDLPAPEVLLTRVEVG